jgi:hypothetical protein
MSLSLYNITIGINNFDKFIEKNDSGYMHPALLRENMLIM